MVGIAVGYVGTVNFSTSDTGPGVILPAVYTFTVYDQGVHTFAGGLTLVTLGDQTLTSTDTIDGTISSSVSVTVAPGPTAPPGYGVNVGPRPRPATDDVYVEAALFAWLLS